MKVKDTLPTPLVPPRWVAGAFLGTALASSLALGSNAVVAYAEETGDAPATPASADEAVVEDEAGESASQDEATGVVPVDLSDKASVLEESNEAAGGEATGEAADEMETPAAEEPAAADVQLVAPQAKSVASVAVDAAATDTDTQDTAEATTTSDEETDVLPTEEVLPEGVYTITSDAGSHYALDVKGGSTTKSANVQLYQQNGTDAQHWQLTYDRNKTSATYGMVKLVNVKSGMALDVAGAVSKRGTNVQQYSANGTLAQWWSLVQDTGASGTSGFMLRSALAGDFVLDVSGSKMVNGTNIQLWTSNNTQAQRFTFVALADEQADTWLASGVAALAKEHAEDLADGTYVISASSQVRAVVDVSSGNKNNKANVQVWGSNGTNAQRWTVSTVKASDGTPWRVITNVNSGKVLDVASGSSSSGTNVWQYASNGSAAQRWAIVSNGNGTYTLRSALAHNLVIDLKSGKTSNKTNVQVYTSNNTAAQKFVFTNANPTPIASDGANVTDGLYAIAATDGKVIDVPSATKTKGTQLQTYKSNGTQAQVFAVTYDKSSGYYHISNTNSVEAVDLAGGDVIAGGKVQQNTYGATSRNQLWLFQAVDDGGYKIVSPYTNLAISLTTDGKLTTSAIASAMTWKLNTYALPDGAYVISNLGNGKVIDVPSATWTSGTQVQTYKSNGTLAQKWYLRRDQSTDGAGYSNYTIQSVSSGKYLASSNSTVVQLPYGKATSWQLGFEQGVGYVLEESGSSLHMLANPKLVLASASGLATEGWSFASTTLDFGGGYEFASAASTGYRLDVSSASKDNKANVQVWTSNSTTAQRWTISSNGNGWFAIFSANSGKVLDVAGGNAASGTNVQQYTSNETNAQQWAFQMGNYGLVLVSKLGDAENVLSVSGDVSKGSNVVVEVENGEERQCWLLKPVSVSTSKSYLIAIDPGHGGSDPGASGNGLTESTLTWKIALAVRDRLVSNGVEVYLTRSQNEYVSVKGRVDRAVSKGAKAIVSVHIDAADASSAHGASILAPNDSSYYYNLHTDGEKLGSYILSNIASLGITSRGFLEPDYGGNSEQSHYADGSNADYYGIVRYARQNGMLGIIVEHGFITNAGDAAKFSSDSFLTKLGQADADGIVQMYGKGGSGAKASSGSTKLASTKTFSEDDAIAGASAGTSISVSAAKASLFQDEDADGTSIMGTSRTTAAQIASYFKSKGKSYPSVYASKGAATIADFAKIVMEEAAAEGVRAEVVFCQAMYETGWLQYGGLVTADKCNFAGLGATGDTSDKSTNYGTGYSYANVRTGIRAQVQHLKAYASTASLNNACVDQRYSYVTKGCAPTVESLSGKWAVPGNGYGEAIAKLIKELLTY